MQRIMRFSSEVFLSIFWLGCIGQGGLELCIYIWQELGRWYGYYRYIVAFAEVCDIMFYQYVWK